MRKLVFELLAIICIIIPFTLMGNNIHELTKSKCILIPPSIAENGRSFVYVGIDSKNNGPAIFISRLKNDGSFSPPTVAVNTRSIGEGLETYFRTFHAKHGEWAATKFRPAGGFSSPTIQDNIITFSANLKDLRKGIFYAIQQSGKWKVYPIALQGQKAPDTAGLTFQDFDAPYITTNSEAIFLASLSNEKNIIYSFNVLPESKKKRFSILCKSSKNKDNFFDISVAKGTFAVPASDVSENTYMYIFNRASRKLIKTVPKIYKGLPVGQKIFFRGPSFFDGKLAYSAYILKGKNKKYTYAIYSNAGGNTFSEPVVISGKLIKSLNDKFSTVIHPTLFIKNKKAFIVFMGQLIGKNNRAGVFLATIKNGNVKISPIAIPDQKIAKDKVIESAGVGAVCIRNNIVPLALKLKNGDNVIAFTKVY